MRSLLLVVLSLGLASSLAAQTYPLLAEDAAGLWGQADGTGCGNDIVVAAFAAAGAKADLKVVSYNRAKQAVLAGQALGCFGMAWSTELEGKVVFADQPIYTNVSTVFARKDHGQDWKKLGDLPLGAKVGTVLGYEYPEAFNQAVASGRLQAIPANSEVQSLKQLALGRLDAVIANLDELKSADYLLRQSEAGSSVVVAFLLEKMGTYLGFSTADARTPAALAAYNKGMALILKNGTLATILERWKARLSW